MQVLTNIFLKIKNSKIDLKKRLNKLLCKKKCFLFITITICQFPYDQRMIFNKEIKPASKLLCTILNTIYLIKYLISLGHCPHFAWNKHGITCLYIYYLFERKHLSIMNIFRNFIRDNSTSWPVVREVHIEFFNNQILKKNDSIKDLFY